MTTRYRHRQIGTVILTFFLAALAFVTAGGYMEGWNPMSAAVHIILIAFIILFYSLTIEIDEGQIKVKFGIGLINRRIYLNDIVAVSTVRNRWYYGWGIRKIPHGWLFNVSGLDAVEVTLASGKRYRLGTDEPDTLRDMIIRNMPKAG